MNTISSHFARQLLSLIVSHFIVSMSLGIMQAGIRGQRIRQLKWMQDI